MSGSLSLAEHILPVTTTMQPCYTTNVLTTVKKYLRPGISPNIEINAGLFSSEMLKKSAHHENLPQTSITE